MIKWATIAITVVMLIVGFTFRVIFANLGTLKNEGNVNNEPEITITEWITNNNSCYYNQNGPWTGTTRLNGGLVCIKRGVEPESALNNTYCAVIEKGDWLGRYDETGLPVCDTSLEEKKNTIFCLAAGYDSWTGEYSEIGVPECKASRTRIVNDEYCRSTGHDLWTGEYLEGDVPECTDSKERISNDGYCLYFYGTYWNNGYESDGSTPTCYGQD